MMAPIVAVLAGGTSAEREVSLGSGRACALALSRSFPTQLFRVDANEIPSGLDPARHVVFSMLHGTFGEDGGMQRLLERGGFAFTGCDAVSSALTMDKTRTKEVAAACGVQVAEAMAFAASAKPSADAILARLGGELVVKPNDEGSSVGLSLPKTRAELLAALDGITAGQWLVEKRIRGRELSIGVLAGRALGVVEIRPHSGVYDYASKYTRGMTDYFAPAPLEPAATAAVQAAAATVFRACGCRDYARVDFILPASGIPCLIEVNTVPGMKETSLLPKSAGCAGLDFIALVREMCRPALARFAEAPAAPALVGQA